MMMRDFPAHGKQKKGKGIPTKKKRNAERNRLKARSESEATLARRRAAGISATPVRDEVTIQSPHWF